MSAYLENSVVTTGLEKVSFHSSPKKGNTKECPNYHTVALISHASEIIMGCARQWISCPSHKYSKCYRKDNKYFHPLFPAYINLFQRTSAFNLLPSFFQLVMAVIRLVLFSFVFPKAPLASQGSHRRNLCTGTFQCLQIALAPRGRVLPPTGAVLLLSAWSPHWPLRLHICCSASAFVTPLQQLFQEVIPDTIFEHLWPLR